MFILAQSVISSVVDNAPLADSVEEGVIVALLAGSFLTILLVVFIAHIFIWVGLWTASSKAGHFGLWACLPIVQFFIWSLMGGKPAWWGLLYFIPLVNIVVAIIVSWEIVKRFDRGIGTTLGLWFLPFIFWPIIGLGSAQYNPTHP